MKLPVITIDESEAKCFPKTIGQRTVQEQTAYVDLGEKYPLKVKFTLPPSRERAYPAGQYVLTLEAFQIGKYGNLELNPWELSLTELVTPAAVKKVS